MNLACTNCHDQKVGQHIREEVISEGHPAGFPILKMSWQGLGTIDRRIRACFSGVQAQPPSAGSPVLRQLELFMKFRSSNTLIEGPSIRR
jgi:sulfur-oxidizing protein SoxA